MNTDNLQNRLSAAAEEYGAKAFGTADLELLLDKYPQALEETGTGFTRAVVAGLRLQDSALRTVYDKPTPLYFHNYRQTNYQLDRMAWCLADIIQDEGFSALAVPASQIIRRDPMRGHVSHKELGRLAGIGFIGRNNLLVHPVHGAQMRYVSVLTDAPLAAGRPLEGAGCGACRACVEACPAGAIGETFRDFDLEACYGKLNEFTRLRFIGQHVCGVCVKACGHRYNGRKDERV